MKVLKFSGSSIDSASKMKDVARIINDGGKKIVVFSAFSGMTKALTEISDYLYKKNLDGANETINQFEQQYQQLVNEIYSDENYKKEGTELLSVHLNSIREFTKDLFTLFEEKIIQAQGELISSSLVYLLFKEQGLNVALIPALDFMRTDKNSEPDPVYLREKLSKQLEMLPDTAIYVTQSSICRNAYGEIDKFEKGESDFSASLIGVAIRAEEIQIWTNLEGMQNMDSRYVEQTLPVSQLQFEEAAELAYFGAKILHPICIAPAKLNRIPVRLMSTLDPESSGTLISNTMEKGKIKAVAAKDGIVAIRIKSGRMLLAHGFLRKLFEIFESYQTAIDMVVTSEVGVSVTIDDEKHLPSILNDLKKYGTVTVDKEMTIICVVGDLDWDNLGFESKIVSALKDIPVRMISYGGSNYNISFLVKSRDKKRALQALSDYLFK